MYFILAVDMMESKQNGYCCFERISNVNLAKKEPTQRRKKIIIE